MNKFLFNVVLWLLLIVAVIVTWKSCGHQEEVKHFLVEQGYENVSIQETLGLCCTYWSTTKWSEPYTFIARKGKKDVKGKVCYRRIRFTWSKAEILLCEEEEIQRKGPKP